jgi:Zn-dependent peptidase ImmA (M78 family)
MGVKGRRIVKNVNEPTLLGNIDDIIAKAKEDGFVNDCIVDIESIVKKENIDIKKEDLPSSISGYLIKINGRWTIGINKNHHVHRQRFTIAHEFAHYCLHKTDNDYFEDEVFFRDDVQTSIEYAANTFASILLMPNDLIAKVIKDGLISLKKLAAKFDVSTLAVKNRVLNLGYKLANDEE